MPDCAPEEASSSSDEAAAARRSGKKAGKGGKSGVSSRSAGAETNADSKAKAHADLKHSKAETQADSEDSTAGTQADLQAKAHTDSKAKHADSRVKTHADSKSKRHAGSKVKRHAGSKAGIHAEQKRGSAAAGAQAGKGSSGSKPSKETQLSAKERPARSDIAVFGSSSASASASGDDSDNSDDSRVSDESTSTTDDSNVGRLDAVVLDLAVEAAAAAYPPASFAAAESMTEAAFVKRTTQSDAYDLAAAATMVAYPPVSATASAALEEAATSPRPKAVPMSEASPKTPKTEATPKAKVESKKAPEEKAAVQKPKTPVRPPSREATEVMSKIITLPIGDGNLSPTITINEGTKRFASLLADQGTKHLNTRDADGNAPLHWACLLGQLELVKMLLQKGARIGEKNSKGASPLHFAVCKPTLQHVYTCELLLKRGAKTDAKDDDNRSPLHYAVMKSVGRQPNTNSVILLTNHKATANVIDKSRGRTPLHYAAALGLVQICNLLIEKAGAPIDAQDIDGATALHLAVISDHPNVAQLLLMRGASIEILMNDGSSPMLLACRYKRQSVLEQCLTTIQRNPRLFWLITRPDAKGFTCAHWLAITGNLSGLKRFPECLTGIDGVTLTPALWAYLKGYRSCAHYFLMRHAVYKPPLDSSAAVVSDADGGNAPDTLGRSSRRSFGTLSRLSGSKKRAIIAPKQSPTLSDSASHPHFPNFCFPLSDDLAFGVDNRFLHDIVVRCAREKPARSQSGLKPSLKYGPSVPDVEEKSGVAKHSSGSKKVSATISTSTAEDPQEAAQKFSDSSAKSRTTSDRPSSGSSSASDKKRKKVIKGDDYTEKKGVRTHKDNARSSDSRPETEIFGHKFIIARCLRRFVEDIKDSSSASTAVADTEIVAHAGSVTASALRRAGGPPGAPGVVRLTRSTSLSKSFSSLPSPNPLLNSQTPVEMPAWLKRPKPQRLRMKTTRQTFVDFAGYLYTGRVPTDRDRITALQQTGAEYGLPLLRQLCENVLFDPLAADNPERLSTIPIHLATLLESHQFADCVLYVGGSSTQKQREKDAFVSTLTKKDRLAFQSGEFHAEGELSTEPVGKQFKAHLFVLAARSPVLRHIIDKAVRRKKHVLTRLRREWHQRTKHASPNDCASHSEEEITDSDSDMDAGEGEMKRVDSFENIDPALDETLDAAVAAADGTDATGRKTLAGSDDSFSADEVSASDETSSLSAEDEETPDRRSSPKANNSRLLKARKGPAVTEIDPDVAPESVSERTTVRRASSANKLVGPFTQPPVPLTADGSLMVRIPRTAVRDADAWLFPYMLEFIYTDTVRSINSLSEGTIVSLMMAARRLGLNSLSTRCEYYLFERVTEKNCCDLLRSVTTVGGCTQIVPALQTYIGRMWKHLKDPQLDSHLAAECKRSWKESQRRLDALAKVVSLGDADGERDMYGVLSGSTHESFFGLRGPSTQPPGGFRAGPPTSRPSSINLRASQDDSEPASAPPSKERPRLERRNSFQI